jgi:hypothetical protein
MHHPMHRPSHRARRTPYALPRLAIRRIAIPALLALALAPALPRDADAQSLRGSRRSVTRMYDRARERDLTFYRTTREVRRAASRGTLVPLRGGADYRLAITGDAPYVLPATRTFVQRLASQYRAACGQRLVVTGAMRPSVRRLVNSSPRSVHPTGMAIDLRKPAGRCLTWLRRTLVSLERRGLIEATEERRPPHFHVAIFPQAYTRYASRK